MFLGDAVVMRGENLKPCVRVHWMAGARREDEEEESGR